jgi:hypothetical protein
VTDSIKTLSVVTILPPAHQKPGQAQPAMGTKVMLSDGSELHGVMSIILTAEPGDTWKATITVRPERIEAITAHAFIIQEPEPFQGQAHDVVEVTTMGERADGVRRYVQA